MGHSVGFSEAPQSIHLIFHQSDQRRNHNRHPVHIKCGQLIAQGLTAPSGHHHKRIGARHNRRDNFTLATAKVVKTKEGLE